MKKRLLTMMLAAALLLAGCGRAEVPGTTPPDDTTPNTTEVQIQYDWMAGESPVPNKRIGLLRAGLNHSQHAVSETGTYFIYAPGWIVDVTPPSPWILYVDNGSDTVVKLCGRPDCTHETTDCNAFVDGAQWISYYGGYLYVVALVWDNSNYNPQTGVGIEGKYKLLRMDPDGTNRVEILDLMEFAEENGGSGAECYFMADGYCLFSINTLVGENGQLTSGSQRTFYYKLDGSMGEPKEMMSDTAPMYNCGDVFLSHTFESKNGGEYGSYWDWDPETDTETYLTDHPGQPGWFGEEEAYYFMDGAVRRLTYATGQEEIVIDTGLEGGYYALCLPDCLIVVSDAVRDVSDKNLYIYNWAFELVDTVEIPCSDNAFMVSGCILAETAERIILSDGTPQDIPRYYIDKAELGTGNVQIHQLDLSDLGDSLQYYEDYLEDQEWLENG